MEGDTDVDELDVDVTKIDTDDKTFALMGISKTIMTVSRVDVRLAASAFDHAVFRS